MQTIGIVLNVRVRRRRHRQRWTIASVPSSWKVAITGQWSLDEAPQATRTAIGVIDGDTNTRSSRSIAGSHGTPNGRQVGRRR